MESTKFHGHKVMVEVEPSPADVCESKSGIGQLKLNSQTGAENSAQAHAHY